MKASEFGDHKKEKANREKSARPVLENKESALILAHTLRFGNHTFQTRTKKVQKKKRQQKSVVHLLGNGSERR